MKKQITLDIICLAISIYILGFTIALAMVATGYEGGDILTEHYRSVLQFIIN